MSQGGSTDPSYDHMFINKNHTNQYLFYFYTNGLVINIIRINWETNIQITMA